MHPVYRTFWPVLGIICGTTMAWSPSIGSGQTSGATAVAAAAADAAKKKKPDFPPHAKVLKDYKKVPTTTTTEGKRSFYTLWTRKKDGQMLAELPKSYSTKKTFIALTVASGNKYAGLQVGDMYVYWRRFDKRLALIAPNIGTRSTGDSESKASVKRLFTDRVILDVPIVTMGPSGGPMIDMDALLVDKASVFFSRGVAHMMLGGRPIKKSFSRIFSIKKAKAFENNVEIAFEVPTFGGRLQTLHYSISKIPDNTGYKPRKADERIGYFVTAYNDLGKYTNEETRVRFINRWHMEKADSKLKMSPPKDPIKFYIEHTTPVRYRRWVRKGILAWNEAFEKVGLVDAIEVYTQDARTKAHMEKDPEDVNYNFIRWLNNNEGMAAGPSRVHPLTGQILDADIVLTDGWIRHFRFQFEDLMPKIAMQGFGPETLAWLAKHPNWDPRIRLAPLSQREYLKSKLAAEASLPYGGHPVTRVDATLIGDNEYDGLVGRTSQVNGMCLAAEDKAFEVELMRMNLAILDGATASDEKDDDEEGDQDEEDKDDEKPKPKDEESKIDGMPESFIGPLLANLVAHEVGHTLGLRHNFKASSVYKLSDINSDAVKGKKPLAGSVMDYTPVNINVEGGEIQGDYAMLGIGPYDIWAIEYGYSFEKDLKPILSRVSEPELQYATDEDTWGPDPLARRYDFSADPLEYAMDRMRLVKLHREQLIDKFVKDGDSWSKVRRGYLMTLKLQKTAVSMMGNWVGGIHVRRDKKGDKDERPPLQVVPAQKQRDALNFVIDNIFYDKVYGLTPELMKRMTVDKWLDDDFSFSLDDPDWPIHDTIIGIQASTLTMIMNPTTLRRVFDNEFRVASDQDMITLPEVLETIGTAIWSELDDLPEKKFTARSPMISSLRRNLQREHLERLIDLSMPGAGSSAAYKPISNLVLVELRSIRDKAKRIIDEGSDKVDPYTKAHLSETQEIITRALESEYIYNAKDIGGGPTFLFFRMKEENQGGTQP